MPRWEILPALYCLYESDQIDVRCVSHLIALPIVIASTGRRAWARVPEVTSSHVADRKLK
jgi:hypothetical protein